MIHIIRKIQIAKKNSIDADFAPKNMSDKRFYPVICYKTTKSIKDGKEIELLNFGFISDTFELQYIAYFNCYVRVDYNNEENEEIIGNDDQKLFFKTMEKIGFNNETK
jgi:hypothetical protein